MESLYHQTNKLIQETQQFFQNLESCNKDADAVAKEIQARIDMVTSNCERLDILVYKEPLNRRSKSKMLVDQLKYDNVHLQAALRTFLNREYNRRREEEEREALLSYQFNRKQETDTTIFIDHSLQHNTSLQNANRGMDDMLVSGSSILENLRSQRSTLKGAHKRLYDIANTLGLSNTTMRLIERRAYQDKFILIGGMILTMTVIGIVIFYFR